MSSQSPDGTLTVTDKASGKLPWAEPFGGWRVEDEYNFPRLREINGSCPGVWR
jgi:hypothetical protein